MNTSNIKRDVSEPMPEVSVIIPSYNSIATIGDCLYSLKNQTYKGNFEIIVVDSSFDGTDDFVKNNFPDMRLFHFRERKFPGHARNIGISKSRGEIIALIDADCRPHPDWIEKISIVHKSSHPVIGGAIDNETTESLLGWASYFCEFSMWMPASRPGRVDDMAGANMTFKRWVFDRFGKYIEGTYCSDTEFHWRLQLHGIEITFTPEFCVSHFSIKNFRTYLNHEFFHGKCFAKVRAKSKKIGFWKGLALISFFPLISLKVFGKIISCHIRNKVYLDRFLKSSPLVFLGLLCWALGEFNGYCQDFRSISSINFSR